MVSGISLVQWFNVYPEFTCVYNLLGVPVINRRVKQSCVVPGRFLVVCLHVYAFVCMFENFARVHVCVLRGANHVAIPAVVCGFSFHIS